MSEKSFSGEVAQSFATLAAVVVGALIVSRVTTYAASKWMKRRATKREAEQAESTK